MALWGPQDGRARNAPWAALAGCIMPPNLFGHTMSGLHISGPSTHHRRWKFTTPTLGAWRTDKQQNRSNIKKSRKCPELFPVIRQWKTRLVPETPAGYPPPTLLPLSGGSKCRSRFLCRGKCPAHWFRQIVQPGQSLSYQLQIVLHSHKSVFSALCCRAQHSTPFQMRVTGTVTGFAAQTTDIAVNTAGHKVQLRI